MNTVAIDSVITITRPSSHILDFIRSKNTHKNPAIDTAERQNRFIGHIPKYIYTYEELPNGEIVIPRGFLGELLRFEPKLSTFTDYRTSAPTKIPPLIDVQLRAYQKKTVSDASHYEQGVIQAPTGSGKTLMGLALIQNQQQRALICVHSKELARQWCDDIKKRMGINAGMVGGGKWQEGEQITICMLQTLSRNEERTRELANKHGLVLLDECHHVPANSFSTVMGWMSCHYRYGLTATPHRRDGLHVLINRNIGKTIATVSLYDVEKVGGVVPAQIQITQSSFKPGNIDSWVNYLGLLCKDDERNELIISLAINAMTKAPTLILTDRVKHAEELANKYQQLTGNNPTLAHGKLSKRDREQAFKEMNTAPLTIGTTGLLGEGLDVSGWGVLVMATPMSGRVKLLQAIGRVIRPFKGKTHGLVIDIADSHPLGYSSLKKRKRIYHERKYTIQYRTAA